MSHTAFSVTQTASLDALKLVSVIVILCSSFEPFPFEHSTGKTSKEPRKRSGKWHCPPLIIFCLIRARWQYSCITPHVMPHVFLLSSTLVQGICLCSCIVSMMMNSKCVKGTQSLHQSGNIKVNYQVGTSS